MDFGSPDQHAHRKARCRSSIAIRLRLWNRPARRRERAGERRRRRHGRSVAIAGGGGLDQGEAVPCLHHWSAAQPAPARVGVRDFARPACGAGVRRCAGEPVVASAHRPQFRAQRSRPHDPVRRLRGQRTDWLFD